MRPFEFSVDPSRIGTSIPAAKDFVALLRTLPRHEGNLLLRHFLTERPPAALRKHPLLYEGVRDWLSERLDICSKEILLIGSGRLGYSLVPRKFGRKFGAESDLDLVIVNARVFEDWRGCFDQWWAEYEQGEVTPRNQREKRFWDENKRVVRNNISRGFIDLNKIPTRKRYVFAQQAAESMYLLSERLKCTGYAPTIKKVTARAYKDWRAFLRQLEFSTFRIIEDMSLSIC